MHKQMTDKSRPLWMKGEERGEPHPFAPFSSAMVVPGGFSKSLMLSRSTYYQPGPVSCAFKLGSEAPF